MNGQQAMARDAAFLRQMTPHLSAEEIERYSWLAGESHINRIGEKAREAAEEDVEDRIREAREEGREAGWYAAIGAQEDLFRDQAKPKLAAAAQRLRDHAAGFGDLIDLVERAL